MNIQKTIKWIFVALLASALLPVMLYFGTIAYVKYFPFNVENYYVRNATLQQVGNTSNIAEKYIVDEINKDNIGNSVTFWEFDKAHSGHVPVKSEKGAVITHSRIGRGIPGYGTRLFEIYSISLPEGMPDQKMKYKLNDKSGIKAYISNGGHSTMDYYGYADEGMIDIKPLKNGRYYISFSLTASLRPVYHSETKTKADTFTWQGYLDPANKVKPWYIKYMKLMKK